MAWDPSNSYLATLGTDRFTKKQFSILLYRIHLNRSLRLYNRLSNDKYKCVFNINRINEVRSHDCHVMLVINRTCHKLLSVARCSMTSQCHRSSDDYRFHLMGTYWLPLVIKR